MSPAKQKQQQNQFTSIRMGNYLIISLPTRLIQFLTQYVLSTFYCCVLYPDWLCFRERREISFEKIPRWIFWTSWSSNGCRMTVPETGNDLISSKWSFRGILIDFEFVFSEGKSDSSLDVAWLSKLRFRLSVELTFRLFFIDKSRTIELLLSMCRSFLKAIRYWRADTRANWFLETSVESFLKKKKRTITKLLQYTVFKS